MLGGAKVSRTTKMLMGEPLTKAHAVASRSLHRHRKRQKIVIPQNPLELKTRAMGIAPHQKCIDLSDVIEPDGDTVAWLQGHFTAYHEARLRKVDDMKHHVAKAAMFPDQGKVYRAAFQTPLIDDRKLWATSHSPSLRWWSRLTRARNWLTFLKQVPVVCSM